MERVSGVGKKLTAFSPAGPVFSSYDYLHTVDDI